MSEFTAQIFAPQPAAQSADLLRAAGVRGVVLPHRKGSMVIAPWEDWQKLLPQFAEAWSLSFEDDTPSLNLEGWRGGGCWLKLEFGNFEWEEFLDEDGLMPDGTLGQTSEERRAQNLANLAAAASAGHLTPKVAEWLQKGLEGRVGVRQLMRLLPSRLGLGVRRWLGPEDLDHRSAEDWLTEYPKAVLVGL